MRELYCHQTRSRGSAIFSSDIPRPFLASFRPTKFISRQYFRPYTVCDFIQRFCRLYELNEHIDILEATINFKNSSISSQELHLAQLVSENDEETYHHSQLHTKLRSLSLRDTQALLVRYFHKVVRLRLEGGRETHRQRETEVRLEGERDAVRRLERSLRQTRADCERELLSQQKVWELQIV